MNHKEDSIKRIYWLNIRLTEAEHHQIMAAFSKVTDRKLSSYARKLLLGKPVKVTYRNTTLDELAAELSRLRRELNGIGNNFNQLVKKINSVKYPEEVYLLVKYSKVMQAQLVAKVEVIKSKINQFSERWYQNL